MPHYIIHYKNDWVKLMVTSTVITHTLSVLYGAMLASNPAVPVFFSLAGRKSKKKEAVPAFPIPHYPVPEMSDFLCRVGTGYARYMVVWDRARWEFKD